MRRSRLLLALPALFVLAARAPAQTVVPGYNPPDTRAALRTLRAEGFREVNAALTEWRAAWRSRDLEAMLQHYTADATLLLPDGRLLQGRDEIERALASILPYAGPFEMGAADFGVCETMAFLVGRFWYGGDRGDRSVAGSYVTVFRLERDRWIVRSQMFRVEERNGVAAREPGGAAADPAPPAAPDAPAAGEGTGDCDAEDPASAGSP